MEKGRRNVSLQFSDGENKETLERFAEAVPRLSDSGSVVSGHILDVVRSVNGLEDSLRENGFMDDEIWEYINLIHCVVIRIAGRVVDKDPGKEMSETEPSEEFRIVEEEEDVTPQSINIVVIGKRKIE